MSRVGIRELRQNLSVYVRRVQEGEAFEVTEHGRPVAMLGPLPPDDDPLAELERRGLRIAQRPKGDLLDVEPLGPPGDEISRYLDEQREDKI